MPRITRNTPALLTLAAALGTTLSAAAAQTLSSPIIDPDTGTRYYRLNWNQPWSTMRAFAVNMGGDLVSIDSAAEQTFIQTNVALPGNKYFIGLSDAATEGTFTWSNGSTATYRNFSPNTGGNTAGEDFALLVRDNNGLWDVRSPNFTSQAIIEVSGPVRIPEEVSSISTGLILASTGPRVAQIANGNYIIPSTIVLGGPLTIRGSGPGTVINSPTGNNVAIFTPHTLTMEKLTLLNQGLSTTVAGVNGANLTFRDCELRSLLVRTNSLFMSTSGNILLERCNVIEGNVVASLGPSSRFDIVNSVLLANNSLVPNVSNPARINITNSLIIANAAIFTDAGSTTTVRNSILFNTSAFGPNTTFQSCLSPNQLPGATNIVATPTFVDAANNNFRPAANSPVIDAGQGNFFLLSGATLLQDLAGNPRIRDSVGAVNLDQGSPIDIGPFEFTLDTGCDDIDFNNDLSIFDPRDIEAFLSVYSEGPCLR